MLLMVVLVNTQGPNTAASSYLAATTLKHVLLFDTRHFSSPILTWAHGMVSEPPQLLSFAVSDACPGTLHAQIQAHTCEVFIMLAWLSAGCQSCNTYQSWLQIVMQSSTSLSSSCPYTHIAQLVLLPTLSLSPTSPKQPFQH